jgi:uncharacterized membrane protein YraQ (UPF0718 family)
VLVLFVVMTRGTLLARFGSPAVDNWSTIFLSLTLQALPFLMLGVLVSAAVSTLVPSGWFERLLPSSDYLAVPVAGAAGVVLPGCECSSAPVAGRLVSKGVSVAPALTFLLAAPAINPVVLVSTAVAFPGAPEMVVARLVASFLAAVAVGLLWARFAKPEWVEARLRESLARSHSHAFAETAVHDLLQAGGFLVLGTALVATLHTLVPQSAIDALGGNELVAALSMALLAVVLSICSEADAFVAAGMTQFSLRARLVFLVVGPMVDIKLISLQVAIFGRRFPLRFAPLTFVVAVIVSLIVGGVLL